MKLRQAIKVFRNDRDLFCPILYRRKTYVEACKVINKHNRLTDEQRRTITAKVERFKVIIDFNMSENVISWRMGERHEVTQTLP